MTGNFLPFVGLRRSCLQQALSQSDIFFMRTTYFIKTLSYGVSLCRGRGVDKFRNY